MARVQRDNAWSSVTQWDESSDSVLGNFQCIQHLVTQRRRGQMIHCGMLWKLKGAPQLNDNLKQSLGAEVFEGDAPKQSFLREG